jgi:hypothetical protein
MVNKDIVNYLKEGKKRGFSVQLLKKKLLEGGFKTNDIDEAVKALGNSGPKVINVKSTSSGVKLHDSSNKIMGKRGGTKWMKIGGWAGLSLLILGILSGVFSSLFPDIFTSSVGVSIVVGVIFLALVFFFYFGFVKLGRHTDSKLLRVGSILTISCFILIPVLLIVANITIIPSSTELLEGGTLSLGLFAITLIVSIGVLVLLLTLSQLLFSIGLVKIGGKVRFSKTAGVLNIIAFVLGIGLFVYLFFVAGTIITNFFSGSPESKFGLLVIGLLVGWLVVAVLRLIANILEVLILFKASKQFENSGMLK